MSTRGIVAIGVLAFGVACANTGPIAVDPEELKEADRRFAVETAQRGTAGWVEAFAVDGKLVSGAGVVDGRDAVAQVMAVLDSPDYSLTWEPEFAEGSGDIGYTYGDYRRETKDAAGETVVEIGRYVTIWRRDPAGEWKVVADMGSAAP